MSFLWVIMPLILGVLFIIGILVFVYHIFKGKKHPLSWLIIGMLLLVLIITIRSILDYMNI
ncbi:hypothetical protein [Ornithinibacillus halophilus]|uniref:Uncharacterized protein n=1 Tax=Ornithinibacillus halophilus TaxID=930117 RepID=A0A1M5P0T5_9BACI|nr:hypothetical protein [Ornithinibacillus halophilus]SHG95039.1 hypothetical protein SAMN05216225_10961 [Ornithinibacillus halophilus]